MSFNDILGQEPAIRSLKKIIETEKIASSYIFLGPEGVGKKKTAISFVQVLNCEKKKLEVCGECHSCKAIARGTYPDFILLEPKGPIQLHHIDTMRQMQNFVNLRSFYEGWKVVIIDEADKMTEEAVGSLLKILEEPPLNTLFILVTSRPENIFETILSRCYPIRFLPLTREVQTQILKGLLKAHPVRNKISNGVSEVVLSIFNGGMEKILAFSTPEREAWRKELFNWNGLNKNIFVISQKISQTDFIMDTLHLLFTWFRDLFFIKQGLREILNKDYEKELTEQARRFSISSLCDNLQAIICAQRDIHYQVNARLVIDTLFLNFKSQIVINKQQLSP